MATINQYLFVYGTLLMSGNEFADYLQAHCKLIGQGKFKGRLYNAGEYPGAIADASTDQYVYGRIYLIDNPQKVLDVIDRYEGIGANEPHPHEYTRELIKVIKDDEVITCWAYLYNWPVNRLIQIAGGNYVQYINTKTK